MATGWFRGEFTTGGIYLYVVGHFQTAQTFEELWKLCHRVFGVLGYV